MKQSIEPESTNPKKLPGTKSEYNVRERDLVFDIMAAPRYRRVFLALIRQLTPWKVKGLPICFLLVHVGSR